MPPNLKQTVPEDSHFLAALRRAALADKVFYRRGEVKAVTGFSDDALQKLVAAGTLTPKKLPGYGWDCYPREQLVLLCAPSPSTDSDNNRKRKL